MKIRVYVPWHAIYPVITAPMTIMIAWSKIVGEIPDVLIVLLIMAQFASIPLGYVFFGKVIRNE